MREETVKGRKGPCKMASGKRETLKAGGIIFVVKTKVEQWLVSGGEKCGILQ